MIVVTGAAGFIGSNIVAALNKRGEYDVVVCDWLGLDGRWMNLRKAMFAEHVFPEDLFDLIETRRPEAVIHMGANSSTVAQDGDEILRVNLNYTLRLIDQCARLGISLVYASSAATYGNGEQGYVDDFSLLALRALRPLNLYGWSKSQIDSIVAWRAEQGMPLPPRCIGLKFFNVYGPNEFHKGDMMSVVGKAHPTIVRGEAVRLFSSHRDGYVDGGQLRDFIHVDDVVSVVLWMLEHGPAVGVFNCGTGRATSFLEFVEAMFTALDRAPRVEFIPMPEHLRARYQYFTEADLNNLRRVGYDRPFMDVEDGVARYAEVLEREDPFR
ncbi:ADP-glyceromanno-heptose 6-epimerase [Sphingobium nicotianae]|uniref:ADP-glyceromanno-heptose 6-epimerase n=1 Tax=Sphingobium nicotianae TaxID=2782607 RepID=A0A9X1DCN3_9SPHN|nr:ADP-glyceromanno-heptose 6-epimerase [Sphingobium nicotianae]MBT2187507.1 ADP-glyceromanno-heptose 6-epimerase [Sphingobium nicotianae]